jgi:aryl-alcohol dehydrogenase-like predicted oxidoreductase
MAAPFSFAPRRELGRTGFRATLLGAGDLADRSLPIETCVATLRRALDFGLNVVDTAPSYESGYSEQIVGQALRGRRDGIFVIDKVDHLDQPVAPQVRESLGRLELPAVDLFVFHGLNSLQDWRALMAPGGRFDELCACRAAGQTRFVGISCHHPEVLREALLSERCDVLLFPVGPFVDARYVDEILPQAKARGVGTVCFKTFGAGKLLGDTAGYGRPLEDRPRGKLSSGGKASDGVPELPHLTVAECVRYTLTCDPDVALLGLSFSNEQDAAFAAARDFEPLCAAELTEVRERAALAMSRKGRTWWNPE